MKIIFAGTPEFSLPAFKDLIDSKHEIIAVYTRPDKPSGRGQKLTESPVKKMARDNNLPLYQPQTLKDQKTQQEMKELNPDILVNVAYGMLLPKEILDIPKLGCINIHPSLLPKFRGAAPIQRAIESCDKTTGVTIMKMDIGLDTGDIYKQETLPIDDNETSETLSKKTAKIGARLLLEALSEIENGTDNPIKQDDTKSSYAEKLTKKEGEIDWNKSAREIDCMVRAFNPWPITYSEINEKYIRILEVAVDPTTSDAKPSSIIQADKNGVKIATGDGVISLLKIQLPGKKPLPIKDILNANKDLFKK